LKTFDHIRLKSSTKKTSVNRGEQNELWLLDHKASNSK